MEEYYRRIAERILKERTDLLTRVVTFKPSDDRKSGKIDLVVIYHDDHDRRETIFTLPYNKKDLYQTRTMAVNVVGHLADIHRVEYNRR